MKNQKQSFSISRELKRKKNKAEVKIAEFDNNIMKPFGAWLASFLWNFVRLGVVPFFAAISITFIVSLCFRPNVSWTELCAYLMSLIVAVLTFSSASLMTNYIRAELKYCHERIVAKRVMFLDFWQVTRILLDWKAMHDESLSAAIRETLGRRPMVVIGQDLGLFLVVPCMVYAGLIQAMLATSMTLGMVGTIAVATAALVGLVNRRLSHLQDPSYLVMVDYAPPTKTLFNR